jgi:hypothetical protein
MIFSDSDPQSYFSLKFGVRPSLVGKFQSHASGSAPDGRAMQKQYWTIDYSFALQAK